MPNRNKDLHLDFPPYVDLAWLDDTIDRALKEDIGAGDITTLATVADNAIATGVFTAKADGILAGLLVAERVFARMEPGVQVDWQLNDGDAVTTRTPFGRVRGSARSILAAERLALNFMQRMSGIASRSHQFAEAIGGTHARILDTRKTVPGLRVLDKWAVALGGGSNHRLGLYDMMLIKDNHITAVGGVYAALSAAADARARMSYPVLVEIEATTLEQVRDIVQSGLADRILLDNMVVSNAVGEVDVSLLQAAVDLVDGRLETEASGNVTLSSVRKIASTGVDYISCGELTHSVVALDISLGLEL